jgi:hypothetical protein
MSLRPCALCGAPCSTRACWSCSTTKPTEASLAADLAAARAEVEEAKRELAKSEHLNNLSHNIGCATVQTAGALWERLLDEAVKAGCEFDADAIAFTNLESQRADAAEARVKELEDEREHLRQQNELKGIVIAERIDVLSPESWDEHERDKADVTRLQARVAELERDAGLNGLCLNAMHAADEIQTEQIASLTAQRDSLVGALRLARLNLSSMTVRPWGEDYNPSVYRQAAELAIEEIDAALASTEPGKGET